MRQLSSQKGFTLLELVVSITLLSIILVTLSGGFNLSIKLWEAGGQKIENHYGVTEAVNLISKQLKTAKKVMAVGKAGEEMLLAFDGDEISVSFVTPYPRVHDAGETGGLFLQKIFYERDGAVLYFEESVFNPLLALEEQAGERFVISEGRVKVFSIEYLVPDIKAGEESGLEEFVWVGEVKPENSAGNSGVLEYGQESLFPKALRLTVETADGRFSWPGMLIPIFQGMETELKESGQG